MRVIAIVGLVLTLGVLALPRHGTPSERGSGGFIPFTGHRAETARLAVSPPRSLGVSLAADHADPPVETITITLPKRKPRRTHLSRRRDRSIRWSTATASAYSAASTGSTRQGCPGAPPLTDGAASFASLIVPCGSRVEFCARRCIVATRTDSGPYVAGRSFDLNVGTVHALIGSWSPFAWGVRRVRWRRVR